MTANVVMSFTAPPDPCIKMYTGPDEMLRVADNGFYVRGVRVPADDKEALIVYNAFKQWLVYQNLVRN